jgi:hypothetical protein
MFVVMIVVLLRMAKAASDISTVGLAMCMWVMAIYYSGCYSICHCQRDVWMLSIAALAVWFRWQQFDAKDATFRRVVILAFFEGVSWGVAIWIKPYVVVPAIFCWVATQFLLSRGKSRSTMRMATDNAALFAGGLFIGGTGLLWLWATGSLEYFFEVPIGWSGQYRSNRSSLSERVNLLLIWNVRYFPWGLLHLCAVGIALHNLRGVFVDKAETATHSSRGAIALLSCLYLGWLAQAVFLQFPHDYVLATPLLIGFPVLLRWPALQRPPLGFAIVLIALLGLVLFRHPLIKANYEDLSLVEGYLNLHGIQDGELLCWDDSSPPLYISLRVSPSSRLIRANGWLQFFTGRQRELRSQFEMENPRFVVTDLMLLKINPDELADDQNLETVSKAIPPALREEFPWREPIVFRAGRYLVHEVNQE